MATKRPSLEGGSGNQQAPKHPRVETDEDDSSFPTTLRGFGYEFNADGQLRDISTGGPFKFEVKPGDRAYNQASYEALGAVMDEHIYGLLESAGLARIATPMDGDASEFTARGFIFATPNALTADCLLVLIHGAGVVRAGQWSRRLIINDSLKAGTVLPYIERALLNGYGVVVTNTNQHTDGNGAPIRGSRSPQQHGVHVWQHYVSRAAAQQIAIVAHSYGGIVTGAISEHFADAFMRRVCAVAFTDSVSFSVRDAALKSFFAKKSINWASSDAPLDANAGRSFGPRSKSAGTAVHEYTSWNAFESVFRFFEESMPSASAPAASAREDL